MKFDDTLSPEGVDAQTMHRRAVSVANRLLGGSGRAELFAFRAQPQHSIPVLAHGTLPDGTFVVAASISNDGVGAGEQSFDVRLDVEKDAPEATLRIRAATMHALGRLTWVDEEFSSGPTMAGQLPELVAGLAGMPGVRIGTVEFPKVLLHDCAGIIPLTSTEIGTAGKTEPFPQFGEELSAAEAVASMAVAEWVEVIEAVLTGRLPGEELTRVHLPTGCAHTLGTVRCVDVDATGVTVMHFTAMDATTVFVPFAAPVADVDGLRAGLEALLASSLAPAF
ncbi:DUF2470 domain-containing protein [Tessaracoccus rhinocerotis]|uniref:DUF2470 domain-containing protein n=1 Tax=Tessaracoccus rhinocerotis TaxID=1689449 RepID=A0A553JYF8_9ACTN|nr:DUF2470 domain-containing protein [Tessaracoccus rhinocerotis]TRY17489.1 DUF2470 domain-containing protein [Tessaracoccus rhinocerotis]